MTMKPFLVVATILALLAIAILALGANPEKTKTDPLFTEESDIPIGY